MKTIRMVDNPVFETVTGLTNTAFDSENIREDRMITEAQMLALQQGIADAEDLADLCCRDMLIWEAYVQIVRLYHNGQYNTGAPSAGGIVVSPFEQNRKIGILRKGRPYTVTFPLKWDSDKYAKCTALSYNSDAFVLNDSPDGYNNFVKPTEFRYVNNGKITVYKRNTYNENTRSGFFTSIYSGVYGVVINPGDLWTRFSKNVADDGTVTIRDDSSFTDFTVIRYYTQWTLRECSNGSLLTDPE